MCFSTEASLGVATVLLPVGGYCVAAALRKDRAYLPLALAPLLFGLQQLFEAGVWAGVGRGNADLTRGSSLGFLFFALVFWPVWVPLAAAFLEDPGPKRRMLYVLAAAGLAFGSAYYLPVAADAGGVNPHVVGHSVRYDLTPLPDTWVWPAVYLAAVCVPLLASRDHRLRPLGGLVAGAAGVAYVAFEEAFASVWCFFAAVLSGYLAFALYRLPHRAGNPGLPRPAPAL